jgi:thiol-disulfide isomerase/thioredoxin
MLKDTFSGRVILILFLLTTGLVSAQSVRTIDARGLDSLLHHRNGKVLLLNIWATWCVPCKEEFPDLVKLSKTLDPRTAEVVAISVDFADEIKGKVAPFVKKMSTPFPVFVQDFPSQDDFINSFDRRWTGAVPATFVYDAKGDVQQFLLGKQRYEQLKKAVDDVTGKP